MTTALIINAVLITIDAPLLYGCASNGVQTGTYVIGVQKIIARTCLVSMQIPVLTPAVMVTPDNGKEFFAWSFGTP